MQAPYESTMQRNDSPQGDGASAVKIPMGSEAMLNQQGQGALSAKTFAAPEMSFGVDGKNMSFDRMTERISNKSLSGFGESKVGSKDIESIRPPESGIGSAKTVNAGMSLSR